MDRELQDFLDRKFSQVDERFTKVDGQFSQVGEKLTQMDRRFSQIDEKLTQMDGRFSQIDEKFQGLGIEMKNTEDRVLHQYHITAEALRDDIKQVGEGVLNLNEKFDRRIDESEKRMDQNHKDVLAAIKFSYAELDRRITSLEFQMKQMDERLSRVESR